LREVTVPTFSEVANAENVDEADEKADHSGVTSLMLVLVGYERQNQWPFLATEQRIQPVRYRPRK
jgi:hypothetical protein